jgi:tetratricopeptide (TPR) repeat protein
LSQELAGDLPGAAESWQRALAAEADDAEGYRRLLRIYSRLKDDAACVRIADQVTQRKPMNADLVFAVAEQALDLRRLDLFDRVAAAFRSARDQLSGRYAEMARLLLRRGLTDEALENYRLAERTDSNHWEEHRLAAVRILIESGRIAEANAGMIDLRKQLPDDPKVGVLSAALLRREGKFAEAMEVLQRVLAANPGELEASIEQAGVYSQQGNHPMAIAILKMCQRKSPDYIPASLELAEAYLRSGMKEAAEITASSALKKDPLNADAQRLLSAARP